jgi:hypothetical protein
LLIDKLAFFAVIETKWQKLILVFWTFSTRQPLVVTMEPMGDQLYQIFQDGYHRAASGSPIGAPGLPPAPSFNGATFPPSLTPINDYSTGNSHGFVQGNNGWSPYSIPHLTNSNNNSSSSSHSSFTTHQNSTEALLT